MERAVLDKDCWHLLAVRWLSAGRGRGDGGNKSAMLMCNRIKKTKRRQYQQPFSQWLTPPLNKNIWSSHLSWLDIFHFELSAFPHTCCAQVLLFSFPLVSIFCPSEHFLPHWLPTPKWRRLSYWSAPFTCIIIHFMALIHIYKVHLRTAGVWDWLCRTTHFPVSSLVPTWLHHWLLLIYWTVNRLWSPTCCKVI